jgi:hypothetical protein
MSLLKYVTIINQNGEGSKSTKRVDKLNQKGSTKAEFQNLNFLMFCPILMQFLFFGKMIIFMCY